MVQFIIVMKILFFMVR